MERDCSIIKPPSPEGLMIEQSLWRNLCKRIFLLDIPKANY